MNIKRYLKFIVAIAILTQFLCVASNGILYSKHNKTHHGDTHKNRPISHECQFGKDNQLTSSEFVLAKVTYTETIKNKYAPEMISGFKHIDSNTGQSSIPQLALPKRHYSTVLII
ncbi:MAG: hypothetical protein AAB606_04185 [Patescibacteria group bacterium]